MLVDGGDQEVADPAESQPNGRAAYYRNHERANCQTGAESSFDRHRQCGQQCQRNTIIEKTLAFQERGKPGIGAELAEGGQHGDRISRGYHRPEEQRHGPRQPERPMDEHTPDNHRQERPRNGEHEDARAHAPQEAEIEDEGGLKEERRQKQKQNDFRVQRWRRNKGKSSQTETQEQQRQRVWQADPSCDNRNNRRSDQQDDKLFDVSHGNRAYPRRIPYGEAAWNTKWRPPIGSPLRQPRG